MRASTSTRSSASPSWIPRGIVWRGPEQVELWGDELYTQLLPPYLTLLHVDDAVVRPLLDLALHSMFPGREMDADDSLAALALWWHCATRLMRGLRPSASIGPRLRSRPGADRAPGRGPVSGGAAATPTVGRPFTGESAGSGPRRSARA